MGMVGKMVAGVVVLVAAALVLPMVFEDFDVNEAMRKVPMMESVGGFGGDRGLEGPFSGFGQTPVQATQAHAIVSGGAIVRVEIVMEQTVNATFVIADAVWLVDGLDASETRDPLRDKDASMDSGATNKSDLWRSSVVSEGWQPGERSVALHLAERAGVQWQVTVPERLEDGRVALHIVPGS